MPPSRSTKSPAVPFVCGWDFYPFPCKGLSFYKEHEGKGYCVLHYPGKDKVAAFYEALKRKLEAKDFNFRGVWFPDDIDLSEITFTTPADFSSATFSAKA